MGEWMIAGIDVTAMIVMTATTWTAWIAWTGMAMTTIVEAIEAPDRAVTMTRRKRCLVWQRRIITSAKPAKSPSRRLVDSACTFPANGVIRISWSTRWQAKLRRKE